MEEQLVFSKLLQEAGEGIALCRPTQDIDVGDICYWDSNGRATRILNVFENQEVSVVFIPGLIPSGLKKTNGQSSGSTREKL